MKKFFAVILICLIAGAAYSAVIVHHWTHVSIDNLVLPDNSIITPGMFLKRTGTSGTKLGLWDNCGLNEIPKWNGGAWACAADAVNTGSNPVFDNVQSGTNTSATLTVGSGGTLTYSGTGIVNASQYKGTTTPSGAEFGYLSGVTSAIQTQIDGKQASLGFTAENVANKSTDNTLGASDTIYPSQKAVKQYVDGKFADNAISGSAILDNSISRSKIVFRGALVYRTNCDQNIDNGVSTALTWCAESYDTDSIHSNIDNTSRLIVPAGITKVRVSGAIGFAFDTNGTRTVSIYKNGGSFVGFPTVTVSPYAVIPVATPIITVSPGDYFEIYVSQTSGSTLGTGSSAAYWFAMEIVQ